MFAVETWIKNNNLIRLSGTKANHPTHMLDIALGIANWDRVCVTDLNMLDFNLFSLYKPRKSVIIFIDFDIESTRFVDYIDLSRFRNSFDMYMKVKTLLDCILDISGWHVIKV